MDEDEPDELVELELVLVLLEALVLALVVDEVADEVVEEVVEAELELELSSGSEDPPQAASESTMTKKVIDLKSMYPNIQFIPDLAF